jgi:hypothetical protein
VLPGGAASAGKVTGEEQGADDQKCLGCLVHILRFVLWVSSGLQ